MKVILHIGWRKTGTSAIQYLLYTSRDLIRARNRINYPEAGLLGRAHHMAAWRFLGMRPRAAQRVGPAGPLAREGTFRDMLRETANLGCGTMLVSSEVLSGADASLPKLARQLKGHSVEVIAYVRRQDRYIESRYNQRIKGGRLTMELAQDARDLLATDTLDYHAHFRRWAAAFGRENVKAKVYDRDGFRQRDVRRDFLDALGIAEDGLVFEESLRNVSLTFSGVHFMRRLNSMPIDAPKRQQVLRQLERHARAHPEHASLFAPDERRAIVERFRESNRRFAREFLGLDDVFEITPEELAAEAALDRTYGEERFREMLALVLPGLAHGDVANPGTGRPD